MPYTPSLFTDSAKDFGAQQAYSALSKALPALVQHDKPVLIADGFSSYVFLVGKTILRVAKRYPTTAQRDEAFTPVSITTLGSYTHTSTLF